MHMMASLLHEGVRADYLADLTAAVAAAPRVEVQRVGAEY